MTGERVIPPYADLPLVEPGGQDRHAWDVFGRDDVLGTVNFVGPQQVRAAASAITEGHRVSLSLPMDSPVGGLAPERSMYEHHQLITRMGRDDVIDRFYPQGSSQWDGLRHIRYRQHGYYGGRQEAELDAGELGVDSLAAAGFLARAVLIDAARELDLRPDERTALTPSDLDAVLTAQGVQLEPGDVVLVRTGWLSWFTQRQAAKPGAVLGSLHGGEGGLSCPGLDPGVETAAWLWDHRVAAVATDNPAVEALPVSKDEGFLHRRLIPLLGMPLGELWDLEAAAEECLRRRTWTFTLVSVPCRLPAAAGSPANALALW